MFWKKKSATAEAHQPETEKMPGPGSDAVKSASVPSSSPLPPVSTKDQIFTEKEILNKIMGLSEPGSTVFFYLSGSPASGGPLGRGAAIIELNPDYPGMKQKRYIIYTDDVDVEQPAGKKQRLFDSDSSKEIAQWIKDRHYKA
jgi:hypothetical protein